MNAVCTVEKYQNSLSKLHSIKLHNDLAKNLNQTLADVYHDFSKMEKWRKSCENLQSSIEKKIHTIFESLKKVKEEIVTCNNNVKTFVKTFDNFENESEIPFKKLQLEFDKFLDDFLNTFLDLRKKIKSALENTKESFLLLNNSELYKQKVENLKNYGIKRIEELLLEASKATFLTFEIFQKNIGQISENKQIVKLFYNTLDGINVQIDNLKKNDSEKLERDYSFLLKPILFPSAYFSLLKEISRRKNNFSLLKQIIEHVSNFVSQDNSSRKDFLAKYGNVLPDSFTSLIPSLKELLNCKIIASFDEFDNLPVLENLDQYFYEYSQNESFSSFFVQNGVFDKTGHQLKSTAFDRNKSNQVEKDEENILLEIKGLVLNSDIKSESKELKNVKDEKVLMENINMNNIKEELEAYKNVFRSTEKLIGSIDFGFFKENALNNESLFKKSIYELLVQNSKIVVSSLESICKNNLKTGESERLNEELLKLKSKIKVLKEKNQNLENENQTHLEMIEGINLDSRKMQLILENNKIEFEKKVQNIKKSMKNTFDLYRNKIKSQLDEIKYFLHEKLDLIKNDLKMKMFENKGNKCVFDAKIEQVLKNRSKNLLDQFSQTDIEKNLELILSKKNENENNFKNKLENCEIRFSFSRLECLNSNNVEVLILCVPFGDGKYVPFFFQEDFINSILENEKLGKEKINFFVNFSSLKTAKRMLIEENNFLIIGKAKLENIINMYKNQKELNLEVQKMDLEKVVAILSFDILKKTWFNLN